MKPPERHVQGSGSYKVVSAKYINSTCLPACSSCISACSCRLYSRVVILRDSCMINKAGMLGKHHAHSSATEHRKHVKPIYAKSVLFKMLLDSIHPMLVDTERIISGAQQCQSLKSTDDNTDRLSSYMMHVSSPGEGTGLLSGTTG